MPRLTALDERLAHQIPEPFPYVSIPHPHWRESYFFVAHSPDPDGDVVILTMATHPQQQKLDCYQMGRIRGKQIFALHERAYGDDPHATRVGPVAVEIVEPFERIQLAVDPRGAGVPVGLELEFRARTQPYALRRGSLELDGTLVWDQSHMVQAGTYEGWYGVGGERIRVDGWLGQRDHSWGVRDHAHCPLWIWLAIQLPDAMLAVWHWERADGSHVYTDGCLAPTDGGEPIALRHFEHALEWLDAAGDPVSYGRDGQGVRGLAGRVAFELEDGRRIGVEARGHWCAPYGPRGGGQHRMQVETDDGRRGSAIYEITGAHHRHFFPIARG